MKPDSRLARMLVAVGSAVFAIFLRLTVVPLAGSSAGWLCFTVGVVAGAWYGGLMPGLTTTALLAVAALFWGEAGGVPLFLLLSGAFSIAMERMRRERIRAERTQTRLHDLMESVREAVICVDNEFRCLYVNDRAALIARKAPGQMFGRSLRTVFPETPGVVVYRELGRMLLEKQPSSFEDKVEQTGRWYEFKVYPVPDGLNLFIRDITAGRALEAERSAMTNTIVTERTMLEAILRGMPAGALIAGMDGSVEFVNQTAVDLFGAPVNVGDSVHVKRSGAPRTPEIKAFEQRNWPLHRTLRRGETISNYEMQYSRPDGTVLTLMVQSRLLVNPDGGKRGVFATYTDITAQRRAQKALRVSELRVRRLLDNPMIGLVSCRGDMIVEANDTFLRMLGFTRQELEEARLDMRQITPPEFRERDATAVRQLRERGFTDPFEKDYLTKDGRRVPVQVGAVSLGIEGWSPWLAFVLDLSERRQLENRLRVTAKLESIGLLAGGIAHDFNNILTGIMGNASVALESIPRGHPARLPVEYSVRATERAAELTRQLLAYAGMDRFVLQPVDVSKLAREISQLIRASIPRQAELELDLADALPPVLADPMQIQQLVMNLVINGAEAVGERPGRVRLTTAARVIGATLASELPAGDYVSITVEDNGCGMDDTTRRRIFDPFFTTKLSGRGLGLAVATGIVRSHNGSIRVESAPRGGSRFEVLLPVSHGGAEVSPDRRYADPVEGKGTILVADDEELVREVAKTALERYGYTVIAAANGRDAVEIYRGLSHSISMVVLDLTMPSMSGEETLRNLAAIHSGTRVLLSSGFSEEEVARKHNWTAIGGLRIAGFIQKPYPAAALVAKVQACLAAPLE